MRRELLDTGLRLFEIETIPGASRYQLGVLSDACSRQLEHRGE